MGGLYGQVRNIKSNSKYRSDIKFKTGKPPGKSGNIAWGCMRPDDVPGGHDRHFLGPVRSLKPVFLRVARATHSFFDFFSAEAAVCIGMSGLPPTSSALRAHSLWSCARTVGLGCIRECRAVPSPVSVSSRCRNGFGASLGSWAQQVLRRAAANRCNLCSKAALRSCGGAACIAVAGAVLPGTGRRVVALSIVVWGGPLAVPDSVHTFVCVRLLPVSKLAGLEIRT